MATDIVATDIVAMDILVTDIVAMDILVTDIVATMVILMGGITGEGTTVPTTGLIIGAFMGAHMVATTTGIPDSGLASDSKTEKADRSAREWRPQRDLSTPEVSIYMWLLFTSDVDESRIICLR
jgi:hypothetical protein